MPFMSRTVPPAIVAGLLVLAFASAGFGRASPRQGVEAQPLVAQTKRLLEALAYIGSPLGDEAESALLAAFELPEAEAVAQIERLLDPRVLYRVQVNAESRVKVAPGAAEPRLVQQGWRAFLVRVDNEAGVTARLRVSSPNAAPLYTRSSGSAEPELAQTPSEVRERWMDVDLFDRRPMNETLSGLALEYRIVEIYSRDAGQREARVSFDVGQGSQDLGFRNEVDTLFDCEPSVEVVFEILDHDGSGTTASLVIQDERGRVYPATSRRLAPDFFFHRQIYRHDGESVLLPPGTYTVDHGRGPEYFTDRLELVVPEGTREHAATIRLRRWIEPRKLGWYSGDHHVHAAGCAHYESPSEGVTPADMMRHILGEDLNVGCVLSWGPCWYYQKEFFEGGVSALSQENHLMRYDVEVSGFPSSHAGHLCLLRLAEDDYPGTTRIEEWPSWDLPVLEWGRQQGGVVGFSHSGWGLAVEGTDLPSYEIPPFDGIGANEYIVDVTHDAVDFISTVDTPYVWELNIWYHTLNCGFRTRISGETDFPCIYGERVGLGRVYCKLDGALDFDRFCEEIKNGRSYVGDGASHLIDFRVGDVDVGTRGSELSLERPGKVTVTAKVAALLDPTPRTEIRDRPYDQQPYWHLERARIGETRTVPLEVVVNGEAVARREVVADGQLREVSFEVPIERSSWIALRILPSSHTNPVFVLVDGRPIRASRRSAEWCLESVDACWEAKKGAIARDELSDAKAAYDMARETYRGILAECQD